MKSKENTMTGKERVREILEKTIDKATMGDYEPLLEYEETLVDEALADIEKVFYEVIGYEEATYNLDSIGYTHKDLNRNGLRTEQRKRWSGE